MKSIFIMILVTSAQEKLGNLIWYENRKEWNVICGEITFEMSVLFQRDSYFFPPQSQWFKSS